MILTYGIHVLITSPEFGPDGVTAERDSIMREVDESTPNKIDNTVPKTDTISTKNIEVRKTRTVNRKITFFCVRGSHFATSRMCVFTRAETSLKNICQKFYEPFARSFGWGVLRSGARRNRFYSQKI